MVEDDDEDDILTMVALVELLVAAPRFQVIGGKALGWKLISDTIFCLNLRSLQHLSINFDWISVDLGFSFLRVWI